MVRALMGFAVVSLLSCSPPYEGAQCRSISQQTNPSTLPLGPTAPITASSLGQPASYFNYTNELACCITNPEVRGQNCSSVKCDEVIAKTTGATVNFTNDPCGPNRGDSFCTVFMQDSKIVGVYAHCRD
jgi:hypothetical protein